MTADHHDWTRNGPGRALLWWPFCSFVSIAVFPQTGVVLIAASGVGLVLLGMAAHRLSAVRRFAAHVVARALSIRPARHAEVVALPTRRSA